MISAINPLLTTNPGNYILQIPGNYGATTMLAKLKNGPEDLLFKVLRENGNKAKILDRRDNGTYIALSSRLVRVSGR